MMAAIDQLIDRDHLHDGAAYQKAENEYNAAKKDVEDRQIELRKLEEITQLDLGTRRARTFARMRLHRGTGSLADRGACWADGGKMYKHYGQLVTFSTNEYDAARWRQHATTHTMLTSGGWLG